MKRILILVVAAIALCAIALMTFAASGTDDEAAPIFGVKIPPGYRDWKLAVARDPAGLKDSIFHDTEERRGGIDLRCFWRIYATVTDRV